ncbi:hypothetical protein [Streptomyces broussonetiae]|uniref:Uncharacterized protein n=1 Tax=Streptomyces broussonetiae TaxID=2686304 RepID=A0A6I6N3A7_9ACTN|nr:hypothetical protein [Streptomyces broussonetiae]QHA05914.1 hypothetical protein GQF42_23855 [Streptomyces broussonetiae]
MTPDGQGRAVERDDAFAVALRAAFSGAGEGHTPDVDLAALMRPAPDPELEARMRALADLVARELDACAPEGRQRLDAVFVLTGRIERARLTCHTGTRSVEVAPSSAVLRLVSDHRELAARTPTGPWWRMRVRLTADGAPDIDYDHGELPIADEDRLPPDAYRADLARLGFPREKLPTWLAAYVGHEDRQSRSPVLAAARARADAEAGVRPVAPVDGLPQLPTMWARWALLSAAFVAAGSAAGPRVRPSHAWFEHSGRGGATLWLLPGDRAVLSGGVWEAPGLAAAYRGDAPFPDLFAGAPASVTDEVLDPRGADGLLSFCYWYEGRRWCRGESQQPEEVTTAVPDVRTADTVIDVVARLTGRGDEPAVRRAAVQLVAAAEARTVTRDMLVGLFGGGDGDVDGALQQLVLADVAGRADFPPIDEQSAIAIVREHMLDNGLETPEYSVRNLAASRLGVGWMVYVPVPRGETRIWRAIFYVADDGVLERSSSAEAPSRYEAGFEKRFHERRRNR